MRICLGICHSSDIKIWECINLLMSLGSSAWYMSIPTSEVLLVRAVKCMIAVIFSTMTVAKVRSRLASGAAVRALVQLLYASSALAYGTHCLTVKILVSRISFQTRCSGRISVLPCG